MTSTKTMAAKLSVALVAASMLFMLVAPAKAQTVEELQAQIAALMAQISALSGSTGGATGGSCVSIPAPLTIGSTGADVTALQNFLISAGQSIPAGATGYFGTQTRAAVAAWQAANGVAPAAGYYGPITKAAMDAKCVPTTPTTPGEDNNGSSTDSVTLKGEADLYRVTVEDAEDTTIEEGDSEAELGVVKVNFRNGDARVDRLDIAFDQTSGSEPDPWDTFDTVSLWVDGDKIAEVDAGSRNDYLDKNDGSLRFSGLNLVAMQDEDVEITVAADIQKNNNGTNDWSMRAMSMRFFDADDVATTDSTTGDLDGNLGGPAADFSIQVQGTDDEVIVKTNSADPSATTFEVKDNAKSNWYTVFVFDLDTDDSRNDITFNNVKVGVTVSTTTYSTLIDDAELIIDGTTIDSSSADVTGLASTTATIDFDVDGDVTVDAGDRVKAELRLKFKSTGGNADLEGATVVASMTGNTTNIDAEGTDDVSNVSGSATGKTHTLRTSGVAVGNFSASTPTVTTVGTAADDTYGTFTLTFDVTGIGSDEVYIPLTASLSGTGSGANFSVLTSTSTSVTAGDALSGVLTRVSGGDSSTSGYVRLDSGDTATLKLTVTFNPASQADSYTVGLTSVGFAATAVPATKRTTLSPATDYDTDPLFITS